jgi:DegV family protein with EDD domain
MSQTHKSQFNIVVDSTCDLGQSELSRLGVTCVPLTVHLQGQRFRDWAELDPEALYTRMRQGLRATTSPPSVDAFIKVYSQLLEDGKPILSLHLSGGISETVEHARQAAKQLEATDRIFVVDSEVASAGLAEFLLTAARLQTEGKTVEETLPRLKILGQGIFSEFVATDLEYLRRGGRLSRAGLVLGNLTGIRPILGFEAGKIVPRRRVRIGQAEKDLVVMLEDYAQGRPVAVTVFHAGRDPVRLQELQNAIKGSKLKVARGRMQLFGCVIGANIGPGAYGFMVVPQEMT